MSEYSERLAQTRLAILEAVQKKQESPGMIRSALNKAAQAAGFGRPHAPPTAQAREAEAPFEEAAGQARVEAADEGERNDRLNPTTADDPAQRKARRAERLFGGRFAGLGEAGRTYWANHPARLVVELATPPMSAYAQRRPFTFLALAAVTGAIVVIARPWRLISVSGLALAALRSPAITSALISTVYGNADGGSDDAL